MTRDKLLLSGLAVFFVFLGFASEQGLLGKNRRTARFNAPKSCDES